MKKVTTLSFRASPKITAQIQTIVKREKRTVSAVLHILVEESLDRRKKAK